MLDLGCYCCSVQYVRALIRGVFFFNEPAPTEIYTLSLHDALPIYRPAKPRRNVGRMVLFSPPAWPPIDRKSTRLNSSHTVISYAVFCLKKKKTVLNTTLMPIHNAETTVSHQTRIPIRVGCVTIPVL